MHGHFYPEILSMAYHLGTVCELYIVILNDSNIDDSFTLANSNLFFSSYEILPTAQEKKYLGTFLHFIMKLYVVCTH